MGKKIKIEHIEQKKIHLEAVENKKNSFDGIYVKCLEKLSKTNMLLKKYLNFFMDVRTKIHGDMQNENFSNEDFHTINSEYEKKYHELDVIRNDYRTSLAEVKKLIFTIKSIHCDTHIASNFNRIIIKIFHDKYSKCEINNNKIIEEINVYINNIKFMISEYEQAIENKKNVYTSVKKSFSGYICISDIISLLLMSDDENKIKKCFLILQKIFSGELDFSVMSSEKKLQKYSFRECYEEFIKSLKDKNDIYFDVLSPQYLPKNENPQGSPQNNKYGEFYNFSSNPKYKFDKDQWEFHLNSKEIEPYGLLNLKNLPPANTLRDKNGDKLVDSAEFGRIDVIATCNFNKNIEEFSFLDSTVCIDSFKTHPSHLDGQEAIQNDGDLSVSSLSTRESPNVEQLDKLADEINSYPILFIENTNKVFMMSAADAHAYDSRFSVYFDKINEILKKSKSNYGSFSYIFYIFLASHGYFIKFRDKNHSLLEDDEICKKLGIFFTTNYFLYTKINLDILKNISQKSYNNTCASFNFLGNCYISKRDFENYKNLINNISGLFNEEHKKLYNIIYKKLSKKEKQILPDNKTINDVILHLLDNIDNGGITFCRATLALYYNKNKSKNDILKTFFNDNYLNTNHSDEKVTQQIQRKIMNYFTKNL